MSIENVVKVYSKVFKFFFGKLPLIDFVFAIKIFNKQHTHNQACKRIDQIDRWWKLNIHSKIICKYALYISYMLFFPVQVRAVELAHKSAFRHGLGNSVYIPKFHIGSLSSETLLHYVANNCTASRCAVVGVGLEHDTLVGFARSLPLKSGDGKSDASTYHGGDARKDTPGNYTHVAVAGPGAGVSNQKEALAFSVLQYAMGAGSFTKRGNVNGAMGQAVHAAVGEGNFAFAALNASYLDAGLFGFVVSADAQKVGKAISAATKVLKSGSVSENDVNRGKALLKRAVLEAYGTDKDVLTEMGVQACLTKQVQSADALVSAIDSVSAQEVQAVSHSINDKLFLLIITIIFNLIFRLPKRPVPLTYL